MRFSHDRGGGEHTTRCCGIIHAVDHDSWQPIGRATLRFCQVHGIRCLVALGQHITNTTIEHRHIKFLVDRYESLQPQGEDILQLDPQRRPRFHSGYRGALRLSQSCQLRRYVRSWACCREVLEYRPRWWNRCAIIRRIPVIITGQNSNLW